MSVPAHVRYILLSILFVLASVNFTRTALEIIENSKRLDELSQEVKGLETRKTQLEETVNYMKTEEYIEEKARNELSLIRPGEKVYVLPEELKSGGLFGTANDPVGPKLQNKPKLDNLDKWLNLIFH